MTPTAEHPLRITPIGLDERQRNALRMIFDGVCRKVYAFAESAAPEAWIVDLDHLGAVDVLAEQWKMHGRHPVLLLSLQDPPNLKLEGETVSSIYLRKPFRVDDFVAHLAVLADAARNAKPVTAAPATVGGAAGATIEAERIAVADGSSRAARLLSEELMLSLVGNNPDVDLSDPSRHALVYYDPSQFLHQRVATYWQQAKEAGRPLAVSGQWPTFVLMPGSHTVKLTAPIRDYRAAAMMPNLQGEKVAFLPETDAVCVGECLSYDSFIWILALWGARGRLPKGVPLDTPVFLRWWPNFTRLDVTPSALAIAALWSREPRTLIDSAKVLRIPQRWLFAFYSAAYALNLAGVTRRSVDMMLVPQPLPPKEKPQGILGRVLDKLRFLS